MGIGTFADGAKEAWVAVFVFDFGEGTCELVGVNEFGVPENLWGLAEVLLYQIRVHIELMVELVLGVEKGE